MSTTKLPLVAIIGRANVGKSSLFNRLLGARKAIVADEPGTTRDRVEAVVEWNGRDFWLVDTAGAESGKGELRDSMNAQLEAAREAADMLLIVLDGSTVLSDEDQQVIKQVYKSDKPFVVAVNKSDRKTRELDASQLPIERMVAVSATHGTRSGDLLDMIVATLPETPPGESTTSPPSLALLGRPNVGKSSLLNAIAGEERAIVDPGAGTTRDRMEIRTRIHGVEWQIIDTAGLRRSSKARDIEYFSALRSSQAINESDVCILVLDATEPATAQDQRIAGMIKEAGKGLVLAVNKWDLSERTDEARKHLETRLAGELPFVWWAPVVLTVAPQQHHIHKLLELGGQVYENCHREVPTSALNQALKAALDQHPPAGLKNRHPKLNYITQTGTQPPTFTVFGSQTPYLHWSYKRYIETRLRDEFDFSGTPIRLQWRSKHGDKNSR